MAVAFLGRDLHAQGPDGGNWADAVIARAEGRRAWWTSSVFLFSTTVVVGSPLPDLKCLWD